MPGRFTDSLAIARVRALDLSGDLAGAVAACMDQVYNFKAAELQARICATRPSKAHSVIYAIGPDDGDAVKIGYATDPAGRLCQLQIGNWCELKIHGLVWIDKYPSEIERLALDAASEMNVRIRGEWCDISAQEGVELILKAARFAKRKVYDSRTWLENWPSRLSAYAEARGIAERITA